MKYTVKKLIAVFASITIMLSFSVYPAMAEESLTSTEDELWYYNFETGESHYESYDTTEQLYSVSSQMVRTRPAYCPPNMTNSLGSGIETMAAIGDHAGTLAHSYPYCAAGTIELYVDLDGDGELTECVGIGTAFLVAEDIILTAAHCIYSSSSQSKKALFFPAQNGPNDSYRTTYRTYVVSSLMSTTYKNTQSLEHDWAICQIKHNRGDTFGWFGLSNSAGVYTNLALSVLGYPGNVPEFPMDPEVAEGYQYKSTGKVTSILSTMRFETTNYSRPGYSGGPFYDSDGIVYGICSERIFPTSSTVNTRAVQFPDSLYDKIIEYCDASAARWS